MPQKLYPKSFAVRQIAMALAASLATALIAVLPAPTFAAKRPPPSTLTAAENGDAIILAARDAYRAGESVRLAKSVEALHDHPLQPWAEYWQLRLQLDDETAASGPQISRFLERHAGSYLADKLRGDWLRTLGKRGDWENFNSEYPKLVQADDEVRCYAAQAADAPAMVRSLYLDGKDLPSACEMLVVRLADTGALSAEDVWQRIRRQFEMKKVGAARSSAAWLPASQGWNEHAKGLESIAQNPVRHLNRLSAKFAASRTEREIALFAIQRLARSNPPSAAIHFEDFADQLSAEERSYGWSQIALQAAMQHRPEALAWFEKANTKASGRQSEETAAWYVRAALRAKDWAAVQRAIAAMPADLAEKPDWIYWLGRALKAQGKTDQALFLFQKIAGQPNFYSNLADEEMGHRIAVPPQAAEPTDEELIAAITNPAFQRALALFRVDMRLEGVREWVFALRGMDDRQLLAVAAFARRHEIWDRAINTADRTQDQHDYSLRYIAPFSDQVRPKARELALDDAWVYGLMRQESRFIMNAKSTVGAKGLMQLMPATARWVAKKINMSGFHPSRVNDMDVNVTLGTNYMRMVLDSLDNHPLLASAAYNAGPGRAKRWRGEEAMEGAIYAETIPFNETRDYVKKVMSNAVYYSALFQEKPQSLKSRLGVIRPQGEGERGVDALP